MESFIPNLVILTAALLGVLLLGITLVVGFGAFLAAAMIFEWAHRYGGLGIALYLGLWLIAFPVMLVLCLIGGGVWARATWLEYHAERRPAGSPAPRLGRLGPDRHSGVGPRQET